MRSSIGIMNWPYHTSENNCSCAGWTRTVITSRTAAAATRNVACILQTENVDTNK